MSVNDEDRPLNASLRPDQRETQPPRAAVLVARVWLEDGELRGRVTHTVDIEQGPEELSFVRHAEEVMAVVRHWLDAVAADPRET